MANYDGDELSQGIEIRKGGKVMTADEVVAELQAVRAQSSNLSRIAQKKLDQMGATVHGVLVKNEAGAWAAVSDAGRVMWLDDFEGKSARQAPTSGELELVGWVPVILGKPDYDCFTTSERRVQFWRNECPQREVQPLYTHPPAKVPEERWRPSELGYDHSIHTNPDAKAWADLFMATFPNCGADPETMHGWFANAMMAMYDHMRSATPTPATTPQPEGDGWIKCSDIAPVIRQLEQYDVRADEHGGKHVCKSFAYQLRQITGLKRPAPPQEQ